MMKAQEVEIFGTKYNADMEAIWEGFQKAYVYGRIIMVPPRESKETAE